MGEGNGRGIKGGALTYYTEQAGSHNSQNKKNKKIHHCFCSLTIPLTLFVFSHLQRAIGHRCSTVFDQSGLNRQNTLLTLSEFPTGASSGYNKHRAGRQEVSGCRPGTTWRVSALPGPTDICVYPAPPPPPPAPPQSPLCAQQHPTLPQNNDNPGQRT